MRVDKDYLRHSLCTVQQHVVGQQQSWDCVNSSCNHRKYRYHTVLLFIHEQYYSSSISRACKPALYHTCLQPTKCLRGVYSANNICQTSKLHCSAATPADVSEKCAVHPNYQQFSLYGPLTVLYLHTYLSSHSLLNPSGAIVFHFSSPSTTRHSDAT